MTNARNLENDNPSMRADLELTTLISKARAEGKKCVYFNADNIFGSDYTSRRDFMERVKTLGYNVKVVYGGFGQATGAYWVEW